MFDLEYLDALRVALPEYQDVHLVLVGCGGTGSWLAPAVVRVARLLRERFNKRTTVTFVDGDTVEEKNIYRQNFCEAEIGMQKAAALAMRYGTAWGMEIESCTDFLSKKNANLLLHGAVVLGCVDNGPARKLIEDTSWMAWIDSGNTRDSGQILIGVRLRDWADNPKKFWKEIFALQGCCGWLPSPAKVHPEIVAEPHKRTGKSLGIASSLRSSQQAPSAEDSLSCAEMALEDSQGLTINQRMAAEAADYLVRLLITKDLRKYATYIDLEAGVTRSEYITEGNLRRFSK